MKGKGVVHTAPGQSMPSPASVANPVHAAAAASLMTDAAGAYVAAADRCQDAAAAVAAAAAAAAAVAPRSKGGEARARGTTLFLGHDDPTFSREWRFLAGCVAFVAVGVVELGRGAGEPGAPPLLLQPVWSWLTSFSVTSTLLFPGWMTLGVFVATCLYFTYLDLTHSESTKLQRDYWPSVEDIFWAAVPQVSICE